MESVSGTSPPAKTNVTWGRGKGPQTVGDACTVLMKLQYADTWQRHQGGLALQALAMSILLTHKSRSKQLLARYTNPPVKFEECYIYI